MEYRPFKRYFLFALFFAGVLPLVVAASVYCAICRQACALIFAAYSLLICYLLVKLYKLSKVHIILGDFEILLKQPCVEDISLSWDYFQSACFTRNGKGHEFLVLSRCPLTAKGAKKYVNRYYKVYMGEVLVLYMDFTQDTAWIKVLIDKKFGKQDRTA